MAKTDTNAFALALLKNSFVYRVGLESSFPFITFLNENDELINLKIDSKLKLVPEIDTPTGLSEEYLEHINLLELSGEVFAAVNCKDNGDLLIVFTSGRKLWVQGFPKDSNIYEPWIIYNETTKDQLICQRGGDYAFINGN